MKKLILSTLVAVGLICSAGAQEVGSYIPRFGAYIPLTNGITYQAPCDGFIIGNTECTYDDNNWNYAVSLYLVLGTNQSDMNIGFRSGGQSFYTINSMACIPIPSGYYYQILNGGFCWLPIINQPLTNTAGLTSNSSFLSEISSNLQIPSLQSAIALQGSFLSNSISSLSNQTSPTNTPFVQAIATNPSFVSTLTSNPALINAIATQIQTGSNNYGLAIKQNQSLNFPAIAPITYASNAMLKLSVTSSAGLTPVTYSTANEAVAKIVSNNVLLIKGVGSTTVTASQAGNALYNTVSVSNTLTVNPISQTISFPAITAQTLSKTNVVKMAATSSAKLPVTYIVANTAIASTNGTSNSLSLIGTGTTTVTATNAGTQNYTPAGAVQTLIVK